MEKPAGEILDQVEDNELRAGEEAGFIDFLAGIPISLSDIEKFTPDKPLPDALNRLITAFNLGIRDSRGLKNCLISVASSFQDIDIPPDYSPSRIIAGGDLLEHLDLIILIIARSKIETAARAKL